FIWATPYSRV
ncbi:hypothetical protein HKBW3S42_00090, partial [Candidatus Hakubella thermalkaliphila]